MSALIALAMAVGVVFLRVPQMNEAMSTLMHVYNFWCAYRRGMQATLFFLDVFVLKH